MLTKWQWPWEPGCCSFLLRVVFEAPSEVCLAFHPAPGVRGGRGTALPHSAGGGTGNSHREICTGRAGNSDGVLLLK